VASDREWAWVEVADSGPGIPQEELAHVFERFYRADKARSRNVPGTGLGLAIVRSIAGVHGGEATASRAPCGGALFRVILPLVKPPFTDLS
jgi:signal transduction histidine kinase